MSISAETYIVISLMFAVFAAVAAVGTSVVLGAGFERLRAGFEIVRRQSGFFSDAIYKLDQRTEKLAEETAKLKSGLTGMGERVERVEKTATFLADSINSIESRILQGTPMQAVQPKPVRLQPVHAAPKPRIQVEQSWTPKAAAEQTQTQIASSGLFRDFPEEAPRSAEYSDLQERVLEDPQDQPSGGLTTLLSRYFTGETSGSERGVVYH
jgi:hypothetical protein